MPLTRKQALFVSEYAIDMNATQAALRAGYSPKTAKAIGADNLTKLAVSGAIEAIMVDRQMRATLTADDIASDWTEAATLDRNELMEVRRTCCRYCHGGSHQYQETPAEHRSRQAAHALLLKATPQKEWARLPEFDALGGSGYDRRKDPHPDCPECWGDGETLVIFKDTRKLSKAARGLYEGVKITKDGFEMKIADPQKARENLAKYLGMYITRHVHTNPDGSPIDMRPAPITFIAVAAGGQLAIKNG